MPFLGGGLEGYMVQETMGGAGVGGPRRRTKVGYNKPAPGCGLTAHNRSVRFSDPASHEERGLKR